MCGIWAYISKNKKDYYEYFKKISNRGPDASVYMNYLEATIGFHRLAIIDKSLAGMQPFVDDNIILICNGEIYNYNELNDKYGLITANDCLTLLKLYKKLEFDEFINVISNEIIGEFAFVIIEYSNNTITKVISGRDTFGVRPLYYSNENNELIFS
jgi:asparagine synthase (glutamine-hydrolysing)